MFDRRSVIDVARTRTGCSHPQKFAALHGTHQSRPFGFLTARAERLDGERRCRFQASFKICRTIYFPHASRKSLNPDVPKNVSFSTAIGIHLIYTDEYEVET